MKRSVLLMAAAVLLLAAGTSMAADTATVNVSATVIGTCRFTSAGTTLSFGTLPFDATGNALGATANSTIQFWCTNGASYTITDDTGANEAVAGTPPFRMASTTLGTPEYIDYSLSYNPATGTGTGPGTPITLNFTGTVGTTYAGNTPDVYRDTVTLTINP